MTTKTSSLPVDETVARLEKLLEAKGVKLFAVVDHSGAAEAAGLELRNTKVVIFGNPAAGTPVMQAVPAAALDLPLKVLVWDDDGETRIVYAGPDELAARYGLTTELSSRLGVIDAITDELLQASRLKPRQIAKAAFPITGSTPITTTVHVMMSAGFIAGTVTDAAAPHL